MINVVYDSDIFIRQKYGGIRLYFSSLIDKLIDFPVSIQPDPILLQSIEPRSYLYDSISHLRRLSFSLSRSFRVSNARNFVYHPTYYTDPFLPYCHFPSVVTIHDLIHEKYYEFFDSSYSKRRLRSYVEAKLSVCLMQRQSLLCLKPLLTIFSKSTLLLISLRSLLFLMVPTIYLFPITPSPLPPSLEFLSRAPFFLYVGSRLNYKGFHVLLRSFKTLCVDFPSLRLVCVGSSFSPEEYKAISDLGMTLNVFAYSALNSELPFLYSSALGFIYSSFCEGFGLPILEALYFNCPVICSNIPPFREVGGGLPFYYSPDNVISLLICCVIFL